MFNDQFINWCISDHFGKLSLLVLTEDEDF